MTSPATFGLSKSERLYLRDEINAVFGEGKAFVVYPLRVVYRLGSEHRAAYSSMLVSVAKKRFRRAVKRNRVKRLVREAYRLNKHLLNDVLRERHIYATIAFMVVSDELPDFRTVERAMQKSLTRIAGQIPASGIKNEQEICD